MRNAFLVVLGAVVVLLIGRERVRRLVAWLRPDRVAPRRARNLAAADERVRLDRATGSGPWTPPSMWRREW